jgi:hypothetical protein
MASENFDDVTLVSTEEAIAEVRRWLEVERVDPERVFTQMGDQVVRYKDLIACLQRDTPDGKLLRFAISRGRLLRSERSRALQQLLQIAHAPAAGGQPADPTSSDDRTPAA